MFRSEQASTVWQENSTTIAIVFLNRATGDNESSGLPFSAMERMCYSVLRKRTQGNWGSFRIIDRKVPGLHLTQNDQERRNRHDL